MKLKKSMKIPRIQIFFCLNLLLAGCTGQDLLQGDGDDLRPLGVASLATPVGNTGAVYASTRAGGIIGLPATSEIGFFMAENTAARYEAVDNRRGTYNTATHVWQPDTEIWMNNMAASLAVYYPYDASQTTAGVLNLSAGPRIGAAGKERELWCTAFKADSRTEDINLVLKQLYSRLTVTFVKSAGKPYTGTAKLTGVKLAGVYASATYHPTEKRYTPAGTEVVTGTLSLIVGEPAAANPVVTDLLLIPVTALTGDITLTATIDGKEMTMKITPDKLANTLAAGKQYTLTVVLLPTGLRLSSLQTTDWDNSPPEITGDATYQ